MPINHTEVHHRPITPEGVPDCRPLYIRRVPEEVWILVHDNANRSRMRLQDYVVEILKGCRPITRQT